MNIDLKKISKRKLKGNNINYKSEIIDIYESNYYESLENSIEELSSDSLDSDKNNIFKRKRAKKEKKINMDKLNINLKQILSEYEPITNNFFPNYENSLSKYNKPVIKICFICSEIGKYTCKSCNLNFCNINCDKIHQNNICPIANISYN